jgi:hypothetical protein
MSTATFNTWLNPNGTENYKCRAWVNFNGTGTVAIRASGNVSSITDNGTGDYTVNFTTAMPDANYGILLESTSFSTTDTTGRAHIHGVTGTGPTLKTISAVRIGYGNTAAQARADSAEMNVAIFR